MVENTSNPSPLRIVAAVILGIFIAFGLFLILALGVGMFNNVMHTTIPLDLRITENIWSVLTLAVLGIICVGGFVWMVYRTPPTPEDEEEEQG